MKKLLSTLITLLAINFIAVAAGVGWLYQSGHLDKRAGWRSQKDPFLPPAVEAPTSQPASDVPEPASQRLAALLARHSGHSAGEQVDFIQPTFDAN